MNYFTLYLNCFIQREYLNNDLKINESLQTLFYLTVSPL